MSGANLMRRLQQPVFILGFQRGGTSLVDNLLLSHPGICKPRGELHQVFHGMSGRQLGSGNERVRTSLAKCIRYLPILICQREDVFSIRSWRERRPLLPPAAAQLDRVLADEKLRAREANENAFKAPGVPYTADEIEAARLVCKNVNALIVFSGELQRLYPDACFVAVVRDGLAVCEGHMRRGATATEAATLYHRGIARIQADAQHLPRYLVMRYEDMVRDPHAAMSVLYDHLGLRVDDVPHVRFVTTRAMGANGVHAIPGGMREDTLVWYPRARFHEHVMAGANENQIQRLAAEDRATIRRVAGDALRSFGYEP